MSLISHLSVHQERILCQPHSNSKSYPSHFLQGFGNLKPRVIRISFSPHSLPELWAIVSVKQSESQLNFRRHRWNSRWKLSIKSPRHNRLYNLLWSLLGPMGAWEAATHQTEQLHLTGRQGSCSRAQLLLSSSTGAWRCTPPANVKAYYPLSTEKPQPWFLTKPVYILVT